MKNNNKPQKVLVFGVGVIGAYLTHALAEAGNEVTVLVREDRAKMLNENGLRIWHHLQKKETVDKVEAVSSIEGRRFDAAFVVMIPFFLVMLAALVLIIGVWNRVSDFKLAYLLSLLFLEVMNWYDGIVIDRLWVGHSRFWLLPGCEDIPYVQTWAQVLKKRTILTLIWIVGAPLVAGIVVTL